MSSLSAHVRRYIFACCGSIIRTFFININLFYTEIGSGRKPSPVLEQSSMVVETVEKKPGSKVTKKFHGDASKVTVKGPGIKKAFMNRAQNFTIDTKDAGMYSFVAFDHVLLCYRQPS